MAYELLFRSGSSPTAAVTDNRMATASVITHAFNELGIASVLGECRGFINFDAELLLSDAVELLPPARTVIELLETVEITPEVIARCRKLRQRGFTFALDDIVRLDEAYTPILPLIDIIKIDVLETPPDSLPAMIAQVRHTTDIQLLAEKVDNREQARQCHELGFELFQGYFFAQPAILQGRRTDPARQLLVHVLQQVLADADNRDIEASFKQAPELSYKLMRLVNSVGMGLRAPISSISHALTILGNRQLQRWVQLLLFAQGGTGDATSPLLTLAASRGRLMELLATKRRASNAECDRAFMTGIFSLLDVLLDSTMDDVLAQISLPDDVRDALLARRGSLGQLLELVEALEAHGSNDLPARLTAAGFGDFNDIATVQVKALTWANTIAQPMTGA